ncbi:MAG: glycosyltransferase family A protein [Flavobacteriaceae bacterium]|nr:glycosyltransferase family A protein [Flavobacteriaceae bacterium]
MFTITVIIPTYNRAHLITRAIKSVLNQTNSNWELIIVDDGSKDNTKEVIIPYLKDYRIKYFFRENQGVCSARNYGASSASGEFLIFLDSDDVLLNKSLSVFNNYIDNNPSSEVILGGIKVVNQQQQKEEIAIPNSSQKIPGFLAGSFCINKILFNSLDGYDVNLNYSENTDLILRIIKSKAKLFYLNDIVLIYNKSCKNQTNNRSENIYQAAIYILEKHKEIFNSDKKIKALYLGVAAHNALKLKNKTIALRLNHQAFLTHPTLKRLLKYVVYSINFNR